MWINVKALLLLFQQSATIAIHCLSGLVLAPNLGVTNKIFQLYSSNVTKMPICVDQALLFPFPVMVLFPTRMLGPVLLHPYILDM